MGGGSANGNGTSVLLVRNGTRLFTEVLAQALKAETSIELLAPPLAAQAALEFCRHRQPDVVVIEATETPAASLRGLVRPIRGACDAAPVVLVVDEVIDDEFLVAGLEAGASGIVDASAGIDEVIAGVRSAAKGKRLVDPSRLADAVVGAAQTREVERHRVELLELLSDREHEVLSHIAAGLRNSEIAGQLSISPRTVEKHVHHILAKLQVRSRLEAVTLALEMGETTHLSIHGTA